MKSRDYLFQKKKRKKKKTQFLVDNAVWGGNGTFRWWIERYWRKYIILLALRV